MKGIKKLLTGLVLFLIPFVCFAQQSAYQRNDSVATPFPAKNIQRSTAAVSQYGEQYILGSPNSRFSPYFNTAVSNTAVLVKGSAGTVSGWVLSNPGGTICYVQIFDAATAGAVTLGTTTPNMAIAVQANSTTHAANTFGIKFTNGIVVAATTTSTGSTGCAAAQVANIFYQ